MNKIRFFILIAWFIVGLTLLVTESVTPVAYSCTWATLLVYIIDGLNEK